ncbi:MAG: hypothetical protein CMJ58_24515 [Planctomycetaceae bacterium]|nr:hypothetical protein [Planctomycetaceae bacterium]
MTYRRVPAQIQVSMSRRICWRRSLALVGWYQAKAMFNPEIVGVTVAGQPWDYPATAPFPPHEQYPEFAGRAPAGAERNNAYAAVRQLLATLSLDERRLGGSDWNPLGELITPGDQVLLKPNLVRHNHLAGGSYQAVVTHASVVRCLLDYAALALSGRGRLIVGDAPVQSANFEEAVARTGLRAACDDAAHRWEIPVELIDFRRESVDVDADHRLTARTARPGDSRGYCPVDLGNDSLLAAISDDFQQFRVTNYDPREMREHHNLKSHEYLIPRTVLESNVVINLPKLKTHRKVGLTAALKNMVGVNGHKDWLPHHRVKSPAEGGDEYEHRSWLKRIQTRLIEAADRAPHSAGSRVRALAIRIANRAGRRCSRDPYREGSWYGNDTLWRTVLDLNRIVLYCDRDGRMKPTTQRTCFSVVDGIIAGDGEGPMEPTTRRCGLLLGGVNAAAVDAVAATLAGFDYRRIPLIARAFQSRSFALTDFSPEDIGIVTDSAVLADVRVGEPYRRYQFQPPSGWRGHVAFGDNGDTRSLAAQTTT